MERYRPPTAFRRPSVAATVTKSFDPDSLGRMVREISAGGVVVHRAEAGWQMAVIEPQKSPPAESDVKRRQNSSQKMLLALPKGLVDAGEKPAQTAVREVREETGLVAEVIAKLTDIKYAYNRSWGDKQRVFKIVSFYLLRNLGGEIDRIDDSMRIEVKRAFWMPVEEAARKLSYRGEREAVALAAEYLKSNPEI